MRRLTRFLTAAAAMFMWFSATAPDAEAVTLPATVATSASGSAACVAVSGVAYGYCLPAIPWY